MLLINGLIFALLALTVEVSAKRKSNCRAKHKHHSHSLTSTSTSHSSSSSSSPSSSSSIPVSSSSASSASVVVLALDKSASSTSSSASPAATSASDGEYTPDQYLALHNDFRAKYGAGALTWNTTLQAYAKSTANTCVFKHTGGPYGENLAAGAGGGYTVTAGFESWSSESSKYDWNNPGFYEATGHFTQVVWKATTQVGCAMTNCADGTIFTGYGTSQYIVCEYFTPGNVVGDNNSYFINNVGTYQG